MRNVLVSGGSRGLGLGIAEALARSGFQVIALARKEGEALPRLRRALDQDKAGVLHFRAADLGKIDAIPALVKNLVREFGPFYGLVNNAGIGTSGILSTMSDHAIEQLIRLNVASPIELAKYVARSMMTGHGGRIVNVSSIVASTGYTGLSVYSATKAALEGFTRSLARELGPLGITVNAVAPGFVATEMTHGLDDKHRAQIARRSALKRMPEVADIAAAVDFLFGDKARNVTGTVTTIDAGTTA